MTKDSWSKEESMRAAGVFFLHWRTFPLFEYPGPLCVGNKTVHAFEYPCPHCVGNESVPVLHPFFCRCGRISVLPVGVPQEYYAYITIIQSGCRNSMLFYSELYGENAVESYISLR